MSAVDQFATTPITESGLVRMLLNPVVVGRVVTTPRALAILTALRSDLRATHLADSSSLAQATVALDGLVGHRQVTDMHLVNLAAEHSVVLVTFDRRVEAALSSADRRHVVTL